MKEHHKNACNRSNTTDYLYCLYCEEPKYAFLRISSEEFFKLHPLASTSTVQRGNFKSVAKPQPLSTVTFYESVRRAKLFLWNGFKWIHLALVIVKILKTQFGEIRYVEFDLKKKNLIETICLNFFLKAFCIHLFRFSISMRRKQSEDICLVFALTSQNKVKATDCPATFKIFAQNLIDGSEKRNNFYIRFPTIGSAQEFAFVIEKNLNLSVNRTRNKLITLWKKQNVK